MINLNPADLGNPNIANRQLTPPGWDRRTAERTAADEGIELSADHWAVVKALQEYFARHEDQEINVRELHDALEERFHAIGGMKRLYRLFPGGPVAQGCRVAGLKAPAGSVDASFGSVQ